MTSGNLGAVTTGTGIVLGAHATAPVTSQASTAAASASMRIRKSLLLVRLRAGQKGGRVPARDVGDNGDPAVAHLVREDPGMPIEPGDTLAVGRILRITRQCYPAHVQREAGRDCLDELIDTVPGEG